MFGDNIVPQIAEALTEHLTEQELAELDEVITPRVASLFAKAFGEKMWDILAPLIDGDAGESEFPAGTAADMSEADTEVSGIARDIRY